MKKNLLLANKLTAVDKSMTSNLSYQTLQHGGRSIPTRQTEDKLSSGEFRPRQDAKSRQTQPDLHDYSTRGVYGMFGFGTEENHMS